MAAESVEVALGPAAALVVARLGTDAMKARLATALRTELVDASRPRVTRVYEGVVCLHLVLSTGHTAIYNELSSQELADIAGQPGHERRERGFYVYDLVPARLGIIRSAGSP